MDLFPHCKKDNKVALNVDRQVVLNYLCDEKRANNCIYLECRKGRHLTMWVSRAPNGPSANFLVQNIHTMKETKLIGNCLKGSRPFLFFDKQFDSEVHLKVIKELFLQTWGTPNGHPKSKPFIDHVFGFFLMDNRIWFRNYQIVEEAVATGDKERGENEKVNVMLVEIGPRFCLNPIRIFAGSMGGPTLWRNFKYLPPRATKPSENAVREKMQMDL